MLSGVSWNVVAVVAVEGLLLRSLWFHSQNLSYWFIKGEVINSWMTDIREPTNKIWPNMMCFTANSALSRCFWPTNVKSYIKGGFLRKFMRKWWNFYVCCSSSQWIRLVSCISPYTPRPYQIWITPNKQIFKDKMTETFLICSDHQVNGICWQQQQQNHISLEIEVIQ